jgi:hypothetical protein
MRKTKEFREINASCFERMLQSLQQNPVLLAVFDNAQIGIQQKHQREGASSLFLKMTAKMFVKVQSHWADADTRGDPFDHATPVTFHDQAIVSPFGMPACESLLDHAPDFAVSNHNQTCHNPFKGVDVTGKRVAACVDHIVMAMESQGQKKDLSRPAQMLNFVNECSAEATNTSKVLETLKSDWSTMGSCDCAAKFQIESVAKWKGKQAPAQLLCLSAIVVGRQNENRRVWQCVAVTFGTVRHHCSARKGQEDCQNSRRP